MQSHVHQNPRPTQIQEEQTQMEKCQHHTVETHGWDTLVWPSLKITLAILCGTICKGQIVKFLEDHITKMYYRAKKT